MPTACNTAIVKLSCSYMPTGQTSLTHILTVCLTLVKAICYSLKQCARLDSALPDPPF